MIDVFWWSKRKSESTDLENFGDFLTPYLLDTFSSEAYRWVKPNEHKRLRFFKRKHYFVIGSILRMATTHTIVWGSGIVKKDAKVPKAKFLAVRGPITRKRLIDLGYKVPQKYGDPALLLHLIKDRFKTEEKFLLGIIPHYVDYEYAQSLYGNYEFIKVINLLSNDPDSVIQDIASCTYILSSSLHGLIVGHSLDKPSLWHKMSDKLYGDDIKFYDYYASIGITEASSVDLDIVSKEAIAALFKNEVTISLPDAPSFKDRLRDLITTFPFKKNAFFKTISKSW